MKRRIARTYSNCHALKTIVASSRFVSVHSRDPRLQILLDKMNVYEDPELTKAHPQSWPCRIEVVMRSEERKTARVDYFKGHAKNPMSDAEVETKFRQLTAPVLARPRADALLARLWDLDRLADIGEVIELTAVDKA